ncbi:family 78 glycoside hydrolase catalytic domain [Neolewinella lacunae]|uniref:Family 78 glycoside hydrolase catalytic domain n=1 Tax=Neolewinella lacunae TaxID=1517758 RepID=A0A923PS90_9BACT|nr:family 78 glycoside hydrolase catalytic domain [Neolewinella lacunae]MBC6995842.1 family 78 glycoside hydrolase catalytic domain [Neolewinella lacunae]MDN3636465.1 family 78 glycoside hydrolase catalytic domain [Neolewinella lacunae]
MLNLAPVENFRRLWPQLSTVCVLLILFWGAGLGAQDWAERAWEASWITHPTAPSREFAVLHFRRTFSLEAVPDSLPVLVSADNRYQLFVNGRRVGEGPARGDLLHWRYETYDLGPYLQPGNNVIAAQVWNYGVDGPWSQHSYRTAFVLQPTSPAFAGLRTDGQWRSYHNSAYSPLTGARERLRTYLVVGPQLRIAGDQFPWNWERQDYADSHWAPAKTLLKAAPAGLGSEFYWALVPRQIPLITRQPLPLPGVVRSGQRQTFGQEPYQLPAGTTDTLLLDFGQLENFFFNFSTTGGKGARLRITYAESLIDKAGRKGQRDATQGKTMHGVYDEFILDGGAKRSYSTPWFRTARYVEVIIDNPSEALSFQLAPAESFAYPFTERGSFKTAANALRAEDIWRVGWQTARMCAQETYVDCPYYEQLQYAGDTRIQALISLYVAGDDRLMRKAILLFDQSRTSDGLTQSRYPSNVLQIIPPYSLSWIEMVGDYWMHRPDTSFVQDRLEGVHAVLNWYHQQLLPNGLVGPTDYWNFVDWTPEWPWSESLRAGGVPDLEGGSSIISLQYALALRTAAKLCAYFDAPDFAGTYSARAERIIQAVSQHCWNAERRLFSDTPAGTTYSQHANILALLTDLAPAPAPQTPTSLQNFQEALLEKTLTSPGLAQVSEYFRFYLIQALYHTGNGHRYPEQLDIWARYLDQGFTTFPEKGGETRSDCHAWSASPNYDLLATFAGIRPASPGFAEVSIQPALAPFAYEAVVAHPQGVVRLSANPDEKNVHFEIELPQGVTGTFSLGSQEKSLTGGINKISVQRE